MAENAEKDKRLVKMLEIIKANNVDTINVIIPGPFAKKVASYALIREDLLHAKEALEALIEMESAGNTKSVITMSLWKSALSGYGKCFNSNKGGYTSLKPDACFSEDKLKEAHFEMMDLRDKHISHRDDTEHENVVAYVKISKDQEVTDEDHEYRVFSTITAVPNIGTLSRFLAVVNSLIPIVEKHINTQAQKALEKMTTKYTPQEITQFVLK